MDEAQATTVTNSDLIKLALDVNYGQHDDDKKSLFFPSIPGGKLVITDDKFRFVPGEQKQIDVDKIHQVGLWLRPTLLVQNVLVNKPIYVLLKVGQGADACVYIVQFDETKQGCVCQLHVQDDDTQRPVSQFVFNNNMLAMLADGKVFHFPSVYPDALKSVREELENMLWSQE